MQKITINAQPRTVIGRQVKQIRSKGFVPGVVYGHSFKPVSVQIPVKEFEKVYAEAGESTLVYLKLDGTDHPTIIHDVARDPRSDLILHADFYRVRLDEKIHAKIPLMFIGESQAVKGLAGILVKNISELEVEGFPQDLPHQINVEISGMANLNDQILVKNLRIDPKLKIFAGLEEIVALVQEPKTEAELEKELEVTTKGVEDVEVIKKEAKEGEAEETAATAESSTEAKEPKEAKK